MIGGGMKTLSESSRPMKNVLPRNAKWIKDAVAGFSPTKNYVTTKSGHTIEYDVLVVAVGMQLNYDKVSERVTISLTKNIFENVT